MSIRPIKPTTPKNNPMAPAPAVSPPPSPPPQSGTAAALIKEIWRKVISSARKTTMPPLVPKSIM